VAAIYISFKMKKKMLFCFEFDLKLHIARLFLIYKMYTVKLLKADRNEPNRLEMELFRVRHVELFHYFCKKFGSTELFPKKHKNVRFAVTNSYLIRFVSIWFSIRFPSSIVSMYSETIKG
jgi:hypothetical protein